MIIPKENQKDLKDFEKDVDGKIKINYVSKIDEVFKLVFVKGKMKNKFASYRLLWQCWGNWWKLVQASAAMCIWFYIIASSDYESYR